MKEMKIIINCERLLAVNEIFAQTDVCKGDYLDMTESEMSLVTEEGDPIITLVRSLHSGKERWIIKE